MKSVHKWFQNKTWVTYTQEHITHTNQPTCAHIFIKQHPKSFPEIGKGITSQTRPLLNASKWNASKALARPASPSSVTGPCACTQSCLTLCNSIGHGPPGSSIHGIFQARILEWDAISFSRASSWLKNQTQVSCISCIGRRILDHLGTPLVSLPWPKLPFSLFLTGPEATSFVHLSNPPSHRTVVFLKRKSNPVKFPP